MKYRVLLFVITCLLSTTCVAQSGYLKLRQDPRIDNLLMKQRQIYVNDPTIDGFRVQIFMELGNEALRHADSVKMVFQERYPDIPVYLVFGQPYFRLRVGDFRTRLEAENLYQRLKNEFRNAFVTADRIELPFIALCSDASLFDYDTMTIDPMIKKIFVEEEPFIIDTLLLDSLYKADSLLRNNDGFFYDD